MSEQDDVGEDRDYSAFRGPTLGQRERLSVFAQEVWLIAFRAAMETRVRDCSAVAPSGLMFVAANAAIEWADVAVDQLRKAGG
jgi:hypothetical protein